MKNDNALQLLKKAIAKQGSLKAVCDFTGINKSTLLHIKAGDTENPHRETLAQLALAGSDEIINQGENN